ncbi:MAG: hypothetical protein R3C56_28450 [Pirellulaceae bacterium]
MLAKLDEANLDVLIVDTHQADMQGWEAIQKSGIPTPANNYPS